MSTASFLLLPRAISLALVAAALASTPRLSTAQNVELGNLNERGFKINGIEAGDALGRSVSGAGDVNGDGLADLIVGADLVDSGGTDSGTSYVVFGKKSASTVDIALLGAGGFRIDGVQGGDRSGQSVSGAGDVNGDGLADLIVGAGNADGDGDTGAGASYVVFGKASSSPVNLAELGASGFRIDGIDVNDRAGTSVSGAGDVNGDGLADLIVGAELADPSSRVGAGESYVVFGKASSSPIYLETLGAGGFRIDGIDDNDNSGASVSGAGDVNGDGLADLIVGAPWADVDGDSSAGESYVVFGKMSSDPVSLTMLGSGGFRIDGGEGGARSGHSVSGAGDVNGDGMADVIVGAWLSDENDQENVGKSHVVFGKTSSTTVNLASLGENGFHIIGVRAGDRLGISASSAGDVNGDGLGDLIVGANGGDPGGRTDAGQSYVVFGKADSTAVRLADLGAAGFSLDGVDAGDRSGESVSGAGDVNGDGLADLVVGAHQASPGSDTFAGESYVVFSGSVPPASAVFRVRNGNGNPPQIAVGTSGDGQSEDSPAARFWIDFADGDGLPDSASSEVITLVRAAKEFFGAAADVSWRLHSTRQSWSSAEIKVRYIESELLISDENSLELTFSLNGLKPFVRLPSVVNPFDNTISANISQPGHFYIGRVPEPTIFSDGFELSL